jgi:hypothetical protein
MPNQDDQDVKKGATETEDPAVRGNSGMQNQLGHRDQDPMLKDGIVGFNHCR